MTSSPGPDGLKIRQTRDATIIRVFPHVAVRPRIPLGASVLGVCGWLAVRGWAPSLRLPLAVTLVLGLAIAASWWFVQVRRSQEVLEVYVGKRQLQLVWSRAGHAVRREQVDLLTLEDARMVGPAVELLREDAAPLTLPMGRHSDEARGWMVEHLRGAGLGAQRRFGHLAPSAGS